VAPFRLVIWCLSPLLNAYRRISQVKIRVG
jgi:hypothetical protein